MEQGTESGKEPGDNQKKRRCMQDGGYVTSKKVQRRNSHVKYADLSLLRTESSKGPGDNQKKRRRMQDGGYVTSKKVQRRNSHVKYADLSLLRTESSKEPGDNQKKRRRMQDGEGGVCTDRLWTNMGFTRSILKATDVCYGDGNKVGIIDLPVCPNAERLCFAEGQICKKTTFFELENGGVQEDPNYEGDDEPDVLAHGTMSAWLIAGNEIKVSSSFSVRDKKKKRTAVGIKRERIARIGVPGRVTRYMVPRKKRRVRGGVTSCRLHAYQLTKTSPVEVAAAVKAAIRDNVAHLNIPIGHAINLNEPPYGDATSLALFDASRAGILPCLAAGNDGLNGYVENTCPFGFCVGASYTKKRIVTELFLVKKKMRLMGLSINHRSSKKGELVFRQASDDFSKDDLSGKIVVIESEDPPESGLEGAEGLVVIKSEKMHHAFSYCIPIVFLDEDYGDILLYHMKEYKSKAVAIIKSSREYKHPSFPELTDFSSQMPYPLELYFQKPDINAPGDATMVARPASKSATEPTFHYEAGTSVSTALVTAASVFVKSHHPDWSSHARKSALMTTAIPPLISNPYQVLVAGVGCINPTKTVNATGFVYDLGDHDYCRLAWGMNCHPKLRKRAKKCCGASEENMILPQDFNYPSFMTTLRSGVRQCIFKRTAKFVGHKPTTFWPSTSSVSSKLTLLVDRPLMHFQNEGDTCKYQLTAVVNEWPTQKEGPLHGEIVWSNVDPKMIAKGVQPTITVYSKVIVLKGQDQILDGIMRSRSTAR